MLKEYNRKRDFSKTPEPAGAAKKSGGQLSFVIQKHDARRLHYDFRLELDGVLLSWAVPKGPSLDPKEKRLAVQTEDHPLSYASFEGVIPKGQYGGGEVIVWDKGVFTPDEDGELSWDNREEAQKRLRQMIKNGKLSIYLEGDKLRGSWALVKMKKTEKEWLLIKHKDAFASSERDITEEQASAVTGRTLEDIRSGKVASKRAVSNSKAAVENAKPERFPKKIMPMLASLSTKPFTQEGWVYEPKLDGIRAVAYIQDGEVRLQSRNGLDLTAQYPNLAKVLTSHKDDMVIDGEIVALDEQGRPSFQHLQQRLNLTRGADVQKAEAMQPILYYVFDILHLDGKNLRSLPLSERKEVLKRTVIPSQNIRVVEAFQGDGEAAYEACVENGLEGTVAKRLDSHYEPGKRSRDWLKVKSTMSSEFIVCGYSQGTGSRQHTFGALIMGEYDGKGELQYVGGVGTGFNEKNLQALLKRMDSLTTDKCPFQKRPPGKLNPTWLKPKLVAEIKFHQRTRDNQLRAPVFLRLREDISPKEAKPTPIVKVKDIPAAKAIKLNESKKKGTVAPNMVDKEVLDQLENTKESLTLEVEGNKIALSNLNKIFWQGGDSRAAITKRSFIQYLTRVAPYILPHLKDRPLTLIRFPNGIEGGKFYQKHFEKGMPGFVETARIFTEHGNRDDDFLLCNNLATILWLGQIADLELHTVHTRINPQPDATELGMKFTGSVDNVEHSILNYPDFLVIDLDPYLYSGKEKKGEEPELHREGFKRACEVAYWAKELLDSLKIKTYIKTSGRTGLHIYVPILRSIDYDTVRGIAEVIGRQLLKDHADALTMDWSVVKRTGRVFFDHNMNARSKSLASIYSPRVALEASISFPLHWENLEEHYPTDFTMERVPQMLAEQGDLWKDIFANKNDLEKLLGSTVGGIKGASAANAPENKEGPVRKKNSRKPTDKKETGKKPRPRQKN